jgi:ankyrin repeat protein
MRELNDTDERGSTACHAAAKRGHHDVLALLLARQPNLAAVDVNGKTAFCLRSTFAAATLGTRSCCFIRFE